MSHSGNIGILQQVISEKSVFLNLKIPTYCHGFASNILVQSPVVDGL